MFDVFSRIAACRHWGADYLADRPCVLSMGWRKDCEIDLWHPQAFLFSKLAAWVAVGAGPVGGPVGSRACGAPVASPAPTATQAEKGVLHPFQFDYVVFCLFENLGIMYSDPDQTVVQVWKRCFSVVKVVATPFTKGRLAESLFCKIPCI